MELSLDAMLKDGFSRKRAIIFLNQIEEEKESGLFDESYLKWANENGFFASSASVWKLTPDNIGHYLSDYAYHRLWPLNSWQRIWINDKMTMYYILAGTAFEDCLPKYYLYGGDSGLVSLPDCHHEITAVQDAVTLLKEVGQLACKPCNGTSSIGFYKLSYDSGKFYINDEKSDFADIERFIEEHPNYVYTEYLLPEKSMADISPLIHTLRIQTVCDANGIPRIAGGNLRFATRLTGPVNHMTKNEDYDLDVEINMENGKYGNAKAVYLNRMEDMPIHPDTQTKIEGVIPGWDELKRKVLGIAKYLRQCEWLAFDVCVAEAGVKIMEINSHGGIRFLQVCSPFFENEWLKKYFINKIKTVDAMGEEEIAERNKIMR